MLDAIPPLGLRAHVLGPHRVRRARLHRPYVDAFRAPRGGRRRCHPQGCLGTRAECRARLSLRTGYRLWERLVAAQSSIRSALCDLAAPPATTDERPIAHTLAHL